MPDKSSVQWIWNSHAEKQTETKGPSAFLNPGQIKTVRQLISGVAGYEPTPLVPLPALARRWGLRGIYVKDESHRFGLNAFKVLGGLYAVAHVICDRLDIEIGDITFQQLISPEIRQRLGTLLFVTATDGNHGRAIAWAARKLGQRATVFMPRGSSPHRLEMIRREGAEACITEFNYDDAVRYACDYARLHQGILVQDTAWEGYDEVPAWIMQGYVVMMVEIQEQLQAAKLPMPTHVFLQSGVGSFAGAVQGYLAEQWGEKRPVTVVLEPDQADCLYRTACIDDGRIHAVTGNLATIMAGLACGEPNPIAWKILNKYAHAFVSCADHLAARGMRILAAPLAGDLPVVSGESGAIGMGLLAEMMNAPTGEAAALAGKLGIGPDSRILLISTEGNTDPEQYRRIVWDGAYPSI